MLAILLEDISFIVLKAKVRIVHTWMHVVCYNKLIGEHFSMMLMIEDLALRASVCIRVGILLCLCTCTLKFTFQVSIIQVGITISYCTGYA